jgi:hypothetical protein
MRSIRCAVDHRLLLLLDSRERTIFMHALIPTLPILEPLSKPSIYVDKSFTAAEVRQFLDLCLILDQISRKAEKEDLPLQDRRPPAPGYSLAIDHFSRELLRQCSPWTVVKSPLFLR